MHSAMSSMLASSRAASSSVLNDRLVSATPTFADALLQLAQRVHALGHRRARPVDPGGLLHGRPASPRGSPRRVSVPRSLAEQVALEPAHLVGRLGLDRRPAAGPAAEAYSAAARPARAPNTRHSGSELEPSRLAPLMLTQAVSPAAYSPAERGRAVDVGVDAAHHVVHDGPDRDQLVHGVDALVLQAQLAHERELGVDQLLAEVPQVEVDDRAVRRVGGAALLHLVHERLGQPVARAELHAAQLGRPASAVPRS